MRLSGMGFVLAAVALAVSPALARVGHSKLPNIIYILADDLGYGDLSCYGQKNFTTPELDRMADEGMRFTAHYAGSTVCAPSRCALLTGRDTGHAYMRGNGNIALPADGSVPNIAARLKAGGYATGMFGKSGVACNDANPQLPHDIGFDAFYGLLDHVSAHYQYPHKIVHNGEWITIDENASDSYSGDKWGNDLYTDAALQWMGKQAKKRSPFFVHLAFTAPHASIACPEEDVAPYRAQFPNPHKNGKGRHYGPCDNIEATYAGMVHRIDRHVGRVLQFLRDNKLDQNTIVFFSSDNGSHFEGGYRAQYLQSNAPWKGGKRDLTDGGIRVPAIVWAPGTIAAGRTSDHVSAFWDFPATALDFANLRPLKETEGISMRPVLTGKGKQGKHEYLYWEFPEIGGRWAIMTPEWKLIRYQVINPKKPERVELFKRRNDPAETSNLADKHPDIVRMLTEKMNAHRTPSHKSGWNPGKTN